MSGMITLRAVDRPRKSKHVKYYTADPEMRMNQTLQQ
jgi:hypothetical protein